jgi:hypothetical protein
VEIDDDLVSIRIISARRPTKREAPQYEELMKDEYDFSDATRAKFYRPDAQLIPPVHLEPQVLAYLAERAKARGVSLGALVNDILKKDIALFEAVK